MTTQKKVLKAQQPQQKSNYSEQIKDPRWQKKRLQILEFVKSKFTENDHENLYFILSKLPKNRIKESTDSEFLDSLSFCFNQYNFPEKLYYDISQIIESEWNNIDLSRVIALLKRLVHEL